MEKKSLKYVAIGDSLTVGVGTRKHTNFVSNYTKSLEEFFKCNIKVNRFAKNGAKTSRVLDFFYKHKVQEAIKEADIITITAGGNDLKKLARKYVKTKDEDIIRETIIMSMQNISIMLKEINKLKQGDTNHIIRLVGLYNPYSHIDLSHKWIRLFNDRLKKFESEHLKVADIYEGFESGGKSALSIDRLHPNKRGYQIISEALAKCGYTPIYKEEIRTVIFPHYKDNEKS